MNKLHYDRADYSVVVKNRAPPPKAWRWEIYRAGNVNPIKLSSIYFETTAAARRQGAVEQALRLIRVCERSALRAWCRKRQGLVLPLGPIARLAQNEKPECAGGEARS
jgi:hypothetical protein